MIIWYVYLLECADTTFYCGITNNLDRRLRQHNGLLSGGARYTSTRRPIKLAFALPFQDKSQAMKLEYRIKTLPRHKKLAFFQTYAGN